MTQRSVRRTIPGVLTAGLMVAGGLLLGPSGAAFAVSATETTAEPDAGGAATTCTVDSAELRWGLKTSFRNYISGSIANGEWTTENGASYETPTFIWANGTGEFVSDLSAGSVEFTGDVHFTGHDGMMRLDLSDPEIAFTGNDSAQLIFGVGSAATAEAELSYERIAIAKVDLAGYTSGDGSSIEIADASVRLTSEGAVALNSEFGDYVAGEEMDGLSLTLAASGCELSSSTGEQEPPAEETSEDEMLIAPAPEEESQIPWLPIVIGGVALIVVGVTVGMLFAGRRKDPQASGPAGSDGGGAAGGSFADSGGAGGGDGGGA